MHNLQCTCDYFLRTTRPRNKRNLDLSAQAALDVSLNNSASKHSPHPACYHLIGSGNAKTAARGGPLLRFWITGRYTWAKAWRIKGLSLYAYEVSCRIRTVRVALPIETYAVSFGFTPSRPGGLMVPRSLRMQELSVDCFS